MTCFVSKPNNLDIDALCLRRRQVVEEVMLPLPFIVLRINQFDSIFFDCDLDRCGLF